MADLSDPSNPLYAFAVDMIAAAVIMNMYGNDNIRPSGTINDPVTYGFVLNNRTANYPARLYETNITMPLAECMDLLTRAGPVEFSRLVYFRGVDSYLAFKVNEDLRDQAAQEALSNDAMNKTLYLAPVLAVSTVLVAYVIDVLFLASRRRRIRASTYEAFKNDAASPSDPGDSLSTHTATTEVQGGSASHPLLAATGANNTRDADHEEMIPLEDFEVQPLHYHDTGDDDDDMDLDDGADDDDDGRGGGGGGGGSGGRMGRGVSGRDPQVDYRDLHQTSA